MFLKVKESDIITSLLSCVLSCHVCLCRPGAPGAESGGGPEAETGGGRAAGAEPAGPDLVAPARAGDQMSE